jgi:hypothetical protein
MNNKKANSLFVFAIISVLAYVIFFIFIAKQILCGSDGLAVMSLVIGIIVSVSLAYLFYIVGKNEKNRGKK